MEKSKECCVCVECGVRNQQALYRKFTGGAIQLSQCTGCKCVVDKYVEFDAVILLLDILLLKIQTYRHLIFNYGITSSFLLKFCVVLIVSETYSKLRMLGLDSASPVTVQIHFHTLLLQSIAELLCILIISFLLVQILCRASTQKSLSDVSRAVIISSFGKLTSIAAVVWAGDYFLWLPTVLVLPAHVQSFRALLDVSWLRVCAVVALMSGSMYCLNYLFDRWRTQILTYLL